MEPTSLDELFRDIAHRLSGVPGTQTVTGACTDSRKVQSGDLFFALKGEAADGHRFVRQALAAGATAAVVSESPDADSGGELVFVEDTLRALGLAARNYRRRFKIPVIGITGSVGKTSVREITAALLRTRYRTLASEKNYNTEVGVPYTLFELDCEHAVAVVEMGMRGHGEIDWLAEIAEPTIGLITNIGHSHIERLGSRDGIAHAKSELLVRLPQSGIAVLPRHDEYFEFLRDRVPVGCRVITYSDSPEHEPDVVVEPTEDGSRIRIKGTEIELSLGSPSRLVARNAAGALAVAMAMDVPAKLLKDAFAAIRPVSGRLVLLAGRNGMTVIDDCYNAAPESMAAALDMLGRSSLTTDQRRQSAGAPSGPETDIRRVAILGDMRELGGIAPEMHRAVGRQVIGAHVRLLVTIGDLAAEIAVEAERWARQTGELAPLHSHFTDSDEAASGVLSLLAPRDLVLVKGSRAMEMEKIVAALTDSREPAPHD